MTTRILRTGLVSLLLALLAAGSAAGSGYDLSIPVRTGDRIDGNGTIAFQALSQGFGDLVFVLPAFALSNLAATVGAAATTAGSHPAANDAGDSAFAFNWCVSVSTCQRRWIGEPAGALLADEFMQDGFLVTDFDRPALNEQGDVAFVASHMDGLVRKNGVYRYDRLTTTTLFREDGVLQGGTVGRQCPPRGSPQVLT